MPAIFCRGKCKLVKVRLADLRASGLVKCDECGGRMRVEGRPRCCPCCGGRLRYRIRKTSRRQTRD